MFVNTLKLYAHIVSNWDATLPLWHIPFSCLISYVHNRSKLLGSLLYKSDNTCGKLHGLNALYIRLLSFCRRRLSLYDSTGFSKHQDGVPMPVEVAETKGKSVNVTHTYANVQPMTQFCNARNLDKHFQNYLLNICMSNIT